MTVQERVAWVHLSATTLATNDMVELKHSLKRLITEATEAHDAVKAELEAQRRQQRLDGRA